MSLFQLGDFTLHSGQRSKWKIECDSLTDDDWKALAAMAAERMPAFDCVIGVPRGGLKFAHALRKYKAESGSVLIADDVLTTGASMENARIKLANDRDTIGVCVFARGVLFPTWITPLFQMPQARPCIGNVDEMFRDLRAAGLDAWDNIADPEEYLGRKE